MAPQRFAARPRRARRVPRLPALALLLGLPACYTWQPVDLAPPPRFGPHASVRVERADGSRVAFDRAQIAGDSLAGLTGVWLTPTTVPLADVTRVWESRFSAGRTAALVVGVLGAGVAFLAYAVGNMEYQ
jgi:hypothetical protein